LWSAASADALLDVERQSAFGVVQGVPRESELCFVDASGIGELVEEDGDVLSCRRDVLRRGRGRNTRRL
jgi:hypothetical protein